MMTENVYKVRNKADGTYFRSAWQTDYQNWKRVMHYEFCEIGKVYQVLGTARGRVTRLRKDGYDVELVTYRLVEVTLT